MYSNFFLYSSTFDITRVASIPLKKSTLIGFIIVFHHFDAVIKVIFILIDR